MTAPTPLETRYRRVLRLLPETYRATWEEDMVGALLDTRGVDGSGSDEDQLAGLGRPGVAEVTSIVFTAVRARLGVFGATPRQALWGEAVRRCALVSLLVLASDVMARAFWDLAVRRTLDLTFVVFSAPGWLVTGPLRTALALASLLWLPAFLALVLDRRVTATVLATTALVPTLVRGVLELRGSPALAPTLVIHLLAVLLPVAALTAFHHGAPRLPRRPWLVALTVGAGLLVVPASLVQHVQGPLPDPGWARAVLLDWSGVLAIGVTIVGAAHLARRRAGRPFGGPAWTLALTLVGISASAQRAASLLDYLRLSGQLQSEVVLLTTGAVELVLVVTVTSVLATVSRADLRAQPLHGALRHR